MFISRHQHHELKGIQLGSSVSPLTPLQAPNVCYSGTICMDKE